MRNALKIAKKLRNTWQEQLEKHDSGDSSRNQPSEDEDIASRNKSFLGKETDGDAEMQDQNRKQGRWPGIEKSETRHRKCDPPPPLPSIQRVDSQEDAHGDQECDKPIPARFGGKAHMPRVDGDEPGCKRTLPCQAETRRKKTYCAHDEDARQITGQPGRRFVELQARGTCEGSPSGMAQPRKDALKYVIGCRVLPERVFPRQFLELNGPIVLDAIFA